MSSRFRIPRELPIRRPTLAGKRSHPRPEILLFGFRSPSPYGEFCGVTIPAME